MSSSPPCRFGFDCRRGDCWFAHPQGRSIDQQSQITQPVTSPQGLGAAPVAVAANAGGKAPAVCRYGRECHRSECWFAHPGGRAIDEEEQLNEADQALDREMALEAEYLQSIKPKDEEEFHCPCCNGRPSQCATPGCVARGRCACMMDALFDEEDGPDGDEQEHAGGDGDWRDEWFPSSRSCTCCEGFIYKCANKNPSCAEKSKCVCAV